MRKIWIYWTLSLALYVGCSVVNLTIYRVRDILKIEFATSPEAMKAYILGVDPTSATNSYYLLKMNTIIDFVYIIGYTLLTILSLMVILSVFEACINPWLVCVSIIAGLLDCIENVFLMRSNIPQHGNLFWIYHDVVRIKWAFAVFPLLVIPVAITYSLIVLFRNKSNDSNYQPQKR